MQRESDGKHAAKTQSSQLVKKHGSSSQTYASKFKTGALFWKKHLYQILNVIKSGFVLDRV